MKKPARGVKVIRIEIHDVDKFRGTNDMCECDAELCAQYVAKSLIMDDIYRQTKELINKIHDSIDGNA